MDQNRVERGIVPEGQHDSSQARSAWDYDENRPSQREG